MKQRKKVIRSKGEPRKLTAAQERRILAKVDREADRRYLASKR